MAPPLNEVCDSEDEEEILSAVIRNVDHRVATDPSGKGVVLPAELDLKASAENSTASTGELLRQAHLDLMAPTQPAIDVAVPETSTSPEMNRTKRRLSVTDAAPPPSSNRGKLKRIKTSPAVTSRRSSQDQASISPRDEAATSDTIPGDPFPCQMTPGNAIPGDTIPGDTYPPGYSREGQTPVPRAHKKLIQQTPSEHKSSSLTPWSESAVGDSSARGSDHDNSSEPPRSDDHLIGLPKEQYKPRPSRSRSDKVTVELPLDYSTRPEKSTKAKRARTIDHSPLKAGAEPEIGPRLFPKNPILQAPEFEALSPPSAACIRVGLVQIPELSRLDLPQTVSETSLDVRSSSTQAKNAAGKPASGRKRGRPRKNPLPEPIEDDLTLGQLVKTTHSQKGSKGDVQVPGDQHAQKILQALAQKFPAQPAQSPEDAYQGEHMHDQKGGGEVRESSATTKASTAKAKATATKAKTAATKAKTAASKAAAKAQELALTKEDSPDPVREKAEPAQAVSDAKEQKAEAEETDSDEKETKQALEKGESEATKTPAQAIKKPTTARSSPATPSWQNRPIHRVGLSKTQKTQSLLKVFRGPR
ncbi:hypothetical protein BDV97DRAFT_233534 [Delphinella strobiligena]|nr:hypothetical protein BDV97DRAFT_233534 [Delphinella strobiligena]